MEPIEFNGKTTEEALQRASEHYNLPLNRLKVEVIDAGSSGLLGLIGTKKARVLVRPLSDSPEQEVADMVAELAGDQATAPQHYKPGSQSGPAYGSERREANHSDQSSPASRPVDEPQEVVDSAREVLIRLIQPLDGEAHVSAQGGQGGIELEIQGGEVGMIIGRRGQTLEALQYLTTRIVSHQQGRPVRINVDAGGYRQRRRESLEDLARRMAEKARATRRPVAVGPFNSQERRVIHLSLRGAKGLSTISRGRGELKKVIISPRH
jgi:spoIIIJ-associated protein